MTQYYKIDTEGNPIKAEDIYDFSKWAVKHRRTKMTQCFEENGMPFEIMTSFNSSEGYFQTFKLDGLETKQLEISHTQNQADSDHSKHVNSLTKLENE